MGSRIAVCLLLAIAFGIAGAIWTFMAGWGFLAAFAAYSFFGSLGLVLTSLAAALIAERKPRPAETRTGGSLQPATAHSG